MGTTGDVADVVVVGAGPAGASAAYHAASAGLSVLLLDKASFPRDKICGDGLTPRAVAELVRMGVTLREEDGWIRNRGLRVVGGGHRIELPWPELSSYPSYGLARSRMSLDHLLVEHARAAGAKVQERTQVTGAVTDGRTGRVVGVRARLLDDAGRRLDADEVELRAPLVVAADGVSARLATSLGRTRRDDRPMGVAVRTYFRTPEGTPRHADAWMESHLELWDGDPGRSHLMPGYGWIFALGDGTANVGLGSVASTPTATHVDYKDLFARWMAHVPADWGFTPENQLGPVRGAALPMGFNRGPLYGDGLMLTGDAAGMVSPFNGEGIAYAIAAGREAADAAAQGLARGTAAGRERAFAAYERRMKDDLGGYYTLGRVFVQLIEHPEVMRLCTRYGLPRPTLMRFVLKLLGDCWEPHGGDWADRTIAALSRLAPAA
ncbi:geranylgeranyl reductase family protein [Cellulomonas marina]|uniref:Geranylgeranyl reductase family n=1 Tax=Cellulomonas marina TaxID=988821 RepID=A0A1I0XMB9_9CELL|nr:geranylgeranyl reductase family protein [Cellulomonas marina]GIG30095.1 drug:proton antiporter [Cellulomonas marina]SFB01123.1 geranylgeranyl reductase family [Cellulomonas marina]